MDEFGLAADLEAAADAPSRSLRVSALSKPTKDPNEADAEMTLTLEPGGDPAETERLERLHERLVSEHVHSTDELVAHRRQFTELAEEQARVQQVISALEARLEDEELVLSLIAAKLRELARP